MTPIYSFGYWVRRRRKALDLTQDELARQVGCAVVTIRKIESDMRRPSQQIAERLAGCLRIADTERPAFLRAALAELPVDRLTTPLSGISLAESLNSDASPPHAGESRHAGVWTFLLTDIQGSTRLWEEYPAAMRMALARHDELLRARIAAGGGHVFKTGGDAFFAVFDDPAAALTAALAIQRALLAEPWQAAGLPAPLRVRIALYTGRAERRDGDFFGPPLNRAARLIAAGHGGQTLITQALADMVGAQLMPDIHIQPLGIYHLRDLDVSERILQVSAPDLPAEFPPLRTPDARVGGLPVAHTTMIGRERERRELADMLHTARLTTIVGPAGVGKTFLAIEVARNVRDTFSDGVYFVPLATLTDPALVFMAIGKALQLPEVDTRPIRDRLAEFLIDRQLLLLLDNCEHLVEATPEMMALLANAPDVRLLATSRASLRVSSEHVYPLEPLACPPHHELNASHSDTLLHYPAVQLFIERAREVHANLDLDEEQTGAIAAICSRLDGLPLAIELAAARTRLFSPPALLARLERGAGRAGDSLRILAEAPRDQPERHRTLHAAIAWSYTLLPPAERQLFRRLAVFAGGWSLDAAEIVCSEPVTGKPAAPVDQLLEELAAQSLLIIRVDSEGEPRFTMLETIREFAAEQAATSENLNDLRQRHAAYYANFCASAEEHLFGAEQTRWLERLDRAHANLSAALEWFFSPAGDPDNGLRMAASLWWFWYMRGYLNEGRAWLERGMASHTSAESQATGAVRAAVLAWRQGDYARATELALIAITLGNEQIAATGRGVLGCVALLQGNYRDALQLATESLPVMRATAQRWGEAVALIILGVAARFLHDHRQAEALLEESLALFRATGDRWGVAMVLGELGVALAWEAGDWARARAYFEESLTLFLQIGDRVGAAHAMNRLARAARQQGDVQRVSELLHAQYTLCQELGDRYGIACALWEAATLLAHEGRFDTAARLFGAADTLSSALHLALGADQATYEEARLTVKAMLGAPGYDAAWHAGCALTPDEAFGLYD